MIRIVIENLLLLLLPTLVYFAFIYLTRRKSKTGREIVNDAPLMWLFAAGVLCAITAIAFFIDTKDGGPGGRYIPTIYKDGELIPGRIEESKPSE
ncbi:MAG: DUF6111 family protein [Hyphomicrobiaceae bacterium]